MKERREETQIRFYKVVATATRCSMIQNAVYQDRKTKGLAGSRNVFLPAVQGCSRLD